MGCKFQTINLFMLPFILILCSCSNDKEKNSDPLPKIYAPKELKDYIVFKPGSYWIYKDSASGVEDSVFAFGLEETFDTLTQPQGGLNSGIYERFRVSTKSNNSNYEYFYNYNANDIHYQPQYAIGLRREKVIPGDYVGEEYCLVYPFNIGLSLSYWAANGSTSINNFYNSFTLDTFSFNEVVSVFQSESITDDDQRTNYLFSRNIGIIRKELIDSAKVWTIVRYHIEQ